MVKVWELGAPMVNIGNEHWSIDLPKICYHEVTSKHPPSIMLNKIGHGNPMATTNSIQRTAMDHMSKNRGGSEISGAKVMLHWNTLCRSYCRKTLAQEF